MRVSMCVHEYVHESNTLLSELHEQSGFWKLILPAVIYGDETNRTSIRVWKFPEKKSHETLMQLINQLALNLQL